MIRVRVPATSANLGPGFDCMGVALTMYNEVCVEEIERGLEIVVLDDSKRFLPQDENNYVYAAMQKVFAEAGHSVKGLRLTLNSNIPVTRGLGSSSAGIVSGLVAANHMIGSPLPKERLLTLATELEGHPDNVAPALYGGFVVSVQDHKRVYACKNQISERLKFAAMIPNFYLQTKKSRSVLPRYTSYRNAVYNIGHASLLTAALISGDFDAITAGMRDRLHESYRLPYIKGGECIMKNAIRSGALGTYVSGAGPTIISVIDRNYNGFETSMNNLIRTRLNNWSFKLFSVDNGGAKIMEEN
ncbi:MAG: homoserine kinase [Ruminococcaceae bacterium]|nr:homoserine kinase [Oscillospiraceae bacterium]